MAITWTLKITPTNIAEKKAIISATRVDDVLGTTFTTSTTGVLDTAGDKLAVLDEIWSDWQKHEVNQISIGTIIGTMEADGKSNLEAREA